MISVLEFCKLKTSVKMLECGRSENVFETEVDMRNRWLLFFQPDPDLKPGLSTVFDLAVHKNIGALKKLHSH